MFLNQCKESVTRMEINIVWKIWDSLQRICKTEERKPRLSPSLLSQSYIYTTASLWPLHSQSKLRYTLHILHINKGGLQNKSKELWNVIESKLCKLVWIKVTKATNS